VQDAFVSVPKDIASKYKIWGPMMGYSPISDKDLVELYEMRKLKEELKKKKK
jgi:hypothetical protein